jgi:hypothetical protein
MIGWPWPTAWGRAPFLSPRVVEAGLGLRPTEKLAGAVCKVALRRIGERWLPREILDRTKQGFVLPMRGLLSAGQLGLGAGRRQYLGYPDRPHHLERFGNIVTETNATNGDQFKYAGMAFDSKVIRTRPPRRID